jgi:hypothetical protein
MPATWVAWPCRVGRLDRNVAVVGGVAVAAMGRSYRLADGIGRGEVPSCGRSIPDSAALHPGYVSISLSRRHGNAVNDLLGQIQANEKRLWIQVVFT